MKVSFNWLKDYVDTGLPAAEVAEKLTMAGIEVKSLQAIGGEWDGVVIGKVLAIKPHPNADRLRLVTVELGGKQQTVVCGAPNVTVGINIAFAQVGTKLVDGHTGQAAVLKPAKIRGVESSGMVCSEKELGISENNEGIMVLPEDAPIGTALSEYLGDVIFNVEVTPNRPDCLSILGLAREVAVVTNSPLRIPDATYPETGTPVGQMATVEINDPDLCPRYCASVITGVKIAESPDWMKKRLISYGMRPINNIVDITNFVMLEWGQPLHSFDYDRIQGKGIVVRRARSGEQITSLDGAERQLTREMLVIADKERAVAVAGIMGGANSEVTENTTSILLESASFKPASVHYTGRILGMPSEACVRFERGISPEITVPALKRATQLIVELGGGQSAAGIIDVYPGKAERKTIRVSVSEVKRLLGIEYNVEQMNETLSALGFEVNPNPQTSSVAVRAPYWRTDVNITPDVIEEVARVRGYNLIPMTLLDEPIPHQLADPMTKFKRKVQNVMVGYGFQEVLTYTMVGLESLTKLVPDGHGPEPLPIHIANPMTVEQEYLRPTLRANLLGALAINRQTAEEGLRIFELGKVYLPANDNLPSEPDMLCGVMWGPRSARSWQGEAGEVDFFDAKGIVEGLLNYSGAEAHFEKSADETLHPSRQAKIIAGGKPVGVIGELHPAVAGHFELNGVVCLFEIDLPALLPFTGQKTYHAVTRFPATVRDIALVLDAGVTHRQVLDTIKGFSLVVDVSLFDVYAGQQVPPGKKSLAYRLTFQNPSRTLTDDEVNHVQQAILKRLSGELGAVLRG